MIVIPDNYYDLKEDPTAIAAWWSVQRFNAASYILAGDLCAAEALAREAAAVGHQYETCWLNDIAVRRGDPSPPELMREIAEKEPDSECVFGLDEWYHTAREAAAAGEQEKAFDGLRRACEYWCNPPLARLEVWEKDKRWGPLLDHPEFKLILDHRRRRIGPVHGELKYFPGW